MFTGPKNVFLHQTKSLHTLPSHCTTSLETSTWYTFKAYFPLESTQIKFIKICSELYEYIALEVLQKCKYKHRQVFSPKAELGVVEGSKIEGPDILRVAIGVGY